MNKSFEKLGKLGLAILEHFVEDKLGKKFVDELHAPSDRTIAVARALERTQDRFGKEFEDKVFSESILSNVSELSSALLVEAVGKFYDHPTDPDFPIALQRLIVTDFPYFPVDQVERGIANYITILTEELILADEKFSQNLSAISAFRSEQTQQQILETLRERHPSPATMQLANFAPGSAPPRPSLLIGRDDDIKALKARLQITSDSKIALQVITAIKGWPGVGKTTIASALAYDPDVKSMFPDGVLWTSLGQKPNILSEMATWGRALGTDEILKSKSIEEAQNLLAGLLRNKRMLLIVDDVWKAEDAFPFKVGGSGCATLITTRLDIIASALAPVAGNIYRLKVLKDEDALELLRQLAPNVVKQHPSECLVLVQELEGLPLALQVAGRLLHTEADYGFDVTQLINELREGAKLLESTAPTDRTDLVTETTPTIAALLQQSLERLDDKTKEYYAYLGVFAPKPATFDMEAMKFVWQVDDPKTTIKTLVDRGLLEFVPELGRYQMHALLVMLAKTLLSDDEE